MRRTTLASSLLLGCLLYIFTVWQACAGLDPAAAKKLIANDIATMDYFGSRVSLSADGNTALIGAAAHNGNKGAAYIFTRSDTGWTQQAKLTPTDSANISLFGFAVSLSADGKTALIGTAYSDAAYVFTCANTTWSQQAKLISNESIIWNDFGRVVSLSENGNTALIGDATERAGYVFIRTNSTWSQQAKLMAEGGLADAFGTAVSLGNDGNTALIGASYDNEDKGAAYVFTRTKTTWSQQAKLTAADSQAYDGFGNAVALASDGSTALIGAQYGNEGKGTAYVFTLTANTWSQPTKLITADGESQDSFGSAVSLSANGSMALISSPSDDDKSNEAGAVYVFTSTSNSWTQQDKLTAQDGVEYDKFGMSVALAANGGTALIGAPVTFSTSRKGAAYVLTEAIPSTPTEKQPKPWLQILLRRR